VAQEKTLKNNDPSSKGPLYIRFYLYLKEKKKKSYYPRERAPKYLRRFKFSGEGKKERIYFAGKMGGGGCLLHSTKR